MKKIVHRRTINIQYSEDVEIPEGLTAAEIDDYIAKFVADRVSGHADDWEWEWGYGETPPIGIDEQPRPPDSYWKQISGVEVATNGFCVLLKLCPIGINPIWPWEKITEDTALAIKKLLAVDYRALPLHLGYFNAEIVADFLELDNIQVRGENIFSVGYILQNDKLLAVLMPLKCGKTSDPGKAARFYEPILADSEHDS